MVIVVYTVVTNNYDRLVPPIFIHPAVTYLCFTDGTIDVPKPWKSVPINLDLLRDVPMKSLRQRIKLDCIVRGLDSTRLSRVPKILAHLYIDADYSIYQDGNMSMLANPYGLAIKSTEDHDIAVLRHLPNTASYSNHDNVYKEAEYCLKKGIGDPRAIRRQINAYHRSDYPAKNGLASCGFLIRRHTQSTRKFNEAWWNELLFYSERDQLSFPYVAWKLGFPFNYLEKMGTIVDFSRHK